MHEHTLNGVIHLFAVFASFEKQTDREAVRLVETYLTRTLALRQVDVYLGLFSDLLDYYAEADDPDAPERGVDALCGQLDALLSRDDKQNFLLQALHIRRFITAGGNRPDALLNRVAELFRIPETERGEYRRFITATAETPDSPLCRRLNRADWRAGAVVLHSEWTGRYFVRLFSGVCTLDENALDPERFYPLDPGAILRDAGGSTLYRCEIEMLFTHTEGHPLTFEADGVNYRFPNSANGLHDLTFRETGGRLIGVMGGSGVGKSTLISVLNGTLRPDSGCITINGIDLYAEPEKLEGVIGYVPQDDLLFEDLTVRENLDYSARLCLAHLPPDQRRERVRRMLSELNQEETADLKVGNPLSKTISGGQRKRLNIALELIREPSVLFVDEPTSGLSSTDSDVVMGLLKAQAARGRLVIVIIHQPSSALFRLFDALWVLDRGGYPVYTGHPLEAARWFREQAHIAGADRSICPECGSVNPEQLFAILETRELDADGHFSRERKYTPVFWHELWKRSRHSGTRGSSSLTDPPPRNLSRPSWIGQVFTFFTRTLRARCANRPYLLINLLEPPLLGGLTAWLCRATTGESYTLGDNPYLPIYFFMAVIVALFLGLSVSAEEIVRDRRVLRRERFLHLSWSAYANAKIIYIALLAVLQTGLCAGIGVLVLQLPGMGFKLWAVLFSVAAFGGLLGLNVSALFKSAVTVYILIPLLLIPQMLLGGLIISYDYLRTNNAPNAFPPLAGEFMASRWAFEALAVEQFQANDYQESFYEADQELSRIDYLRNDLIPALIGRLDALYLDSISPEQRETTRRLLNDHFTELEATCCPTSQLVSALAKLNPPDRAGLDDLKNTLRDTAKRLQNERLVLQTRRNEIQDQRLATHGEAGLSTLIKQHSNRAVSELVRNKKQLAPYRIQDARIVQFSDPVYQQPDSALGRAPFMAGHKRLGRWIVRSYFFDLSVLWLMNAALAWALIGINALRRGRRPSSPACVPPRSLRFSFMRLAGRSPSRGIRIL